MERSPDDVPVALSFEPKAVVVLSIAFVRTFSWRWPVVLSSPLGHSRAQYATPGLAFKSPPGVDACAFHNVWGPQHDPAERSAAPRGPTWAREQAWLHLSGQSSTSLPSWRAASPIPTYHRHDTGGLLLRARQPHRFSESLAFPQQRLPGQVFERTWCYARVSDHSHARMQ